MRQGKSKPQKKLGQHMQFYHPEIGNEQRKKLLKFAKTATKSQIGIPQLKFTRQQKKLTQMFTIVDSDPEEEMSDSELAPLQGEVLPRGTSRGFPSSQ